MLPSLRKINQSEVAQERLKIINFYHQYGEAATKIAFGADRKVVSRWQKKFKASDGRLISLVPNSTSPKQVRQPVTHPKVVDFIGQFRELHPGTGKEKLKLDIDEFCQKEQLPTISASTVGRVIKRYHFFLSKAGKGLP